MPTRTILKRPGTSRGNSTRDARISRPQSLLQVPTTAREPSPLTGGKFPDGFVMNNDYHKNDLARNKEYYHNSRTWEQDGGPVVKPADRLIAPSVSPEKAKINEEPDQQGFSVYALLMGAFLGSINLNRLISRYFDPSDHTTTLELFLAIAMFAFAAVGYYQRQLENGNVRQDQALVAAVGFATVWAVIRNGDHVISFLGALPPCLWTALAASTVLHETE